jgi:alanyl-tRNA synthetase
MQKYVVVTSKDGREVTHLIEQQTPQLAADFAERQRLESVALRVSTTWEVAGRCGRCSAIIFKNGQHNKGSRGVYCEAC